MKRGEDIMLGVSLIGDWPPSHFVSRYRDGWFLEDVDGNRYIDWLAGWASSPLGGNHPELVEAAHTALKEYGTECLSSLTTSHQYELAEKLVEIAPKPLTKVVYDTTGSEVVENAVRIMREAAGPSRPFVITFLGSFHGGNYGTGAMGPHNAHYNHGIEPFMSGWINVPFPTCYRCPYHLDYPSLRHRLPRLHRGDDPQVQGDAGQHRRRQRRVHPGRERHPDPAAGVAEAPVGALQEVRLDPLQRRGPGGHGPLRRVVPGRRVPGRGGRAALARQGHVRRPDPHLLHPRVGPHERAGRRTLHRRHLRRLPRRLRRRHQAHRDHQARQRARQRQGDRDASPRPSSAP